MARKLKRKESLSIVKTVAMWKASGSHPSGSICYSEFYFRKGNFIRSLQENLKKAA
jgi:hypothetical protein